MDMIRGIGSRGTLTGLSGTESHARVSQLFRLCISLHTIASRPRCPPATPDSLGHDCRWPHSPARLGEDLYRPLTTMTLRISPLLLLLLLALLPTAGAASAPPPVTPEEIRLHERVQYLEDPGHTLSLDQVREPGRPWQANGRTAFNKGYSASTWWLKLTLANPTAKEQPRLLEVGYAALDYVDIFVLDNGVPDNGALQVQFQLGDKLPYPARPVDHRFFIAPITWQPGQTLDIYLRVRTSGSVQVPLTLWSYKRFHSVDYVASMLEGIYFGGMGTIALYNLLIFFVLRDRNYLFYVCFMLSTVMTLAAQSGLAFRFLWPQATHWNDLAIVFFTAATGAFASAFTLRFLRVDHLSRWLGRVLRGMVGLSGLLMLLVFVVPYHLIAVAILLNIMVTITVSVIVGLYALLRGEPSAQIYMVAWSFLLVGATVVTLSRLGMLPINVFTEYSTQLGSLLEAILLSLALADRINTERKLRFSAQSEALLASQHANAELEQRVLERTAALERLNRQWQQFSETDQLSRLANRRALENRLQAEWSRCLRQQQPLTVILLDIDHFKQVNDKHGHPAGDACIQQVAAILGKTLHRPADFAARYGGEEFCLVLPETDSEGGALVAERLRQQIAATVISLPSLHFKVTISLGVFAALPTEQLAPDTYIQRADAALYQSKQSGRNRVTIAA